MYNQFAEDIQEPTTHEIEEVDHYIYLSQCISMDSASKEQEITLGWQALAERARVRSSEIKTF